MISAGSLSLILLTSLRSLGFEGSGFLRLPFLESFFEKSCLGFRPWVELLHLGFIGEWVLLGLVMESDGRPLSSQF